MISRWERTKPAPRRLTATERLTLRFAEGLATLAVMIFATTLPPAVTFTAGIAWAFVLWELAKWEAAGGG